MGVGDLACEKGVMPQICTQLLAQLGKARAVRTMASRGNLGRLRNNPKNYSQRMPPKPLKDLAL